MKHILFLTTLLVSSVQADTMGWHFPLERLTASLHPNYAAPDPRAPQLEEAPGESAFFEEGDPLLDISRIFDRSFIEGIQRDDPFSPEPDANRNNKGELGCDWVVWNQRSGMIVARGSSAQLLLLDHLLEIHSLPCQVRTTFTFQSSEGDTQTVMLSGRSSEKSEISSRGIKCTTVHWVTEDREHINTQLSINRDLPNGDVLQINTTIGMPNHTTMRVAEWEEFGTGWTIDVHTRIFTPAGVAFDEVRWIESGGKLKNYRVFYGNQARPTTTSQDMGGMVARSFEVAPNFLDQITSPPCDKATNQDAPSPLPRMLEQFENGEPVDLRDSLQELGISFATPDSLALLFPNPTRLFVANDETNLHRVEGIVLGSISDPPPVISTKADWNFGHASIVSNSGDVGSIKFTRIEEPYAYFEAAANGGSHNHSVDLQFALKPSATPLELGFSLSLFNNTEVEAAKFTAEGETHPVKLTSKILEF